MSGPPLHVAAVGPTIHKILGLGVALRPCPEEAETTRLSG